VIVQLLANGLVNGCLFAILATGFALIYNTTRIFHIAHGAVYVAAGYVYYWVFSQVHDSTAAALAAVVFSAVFGWLIDVLVYSPLVRRNASPLVFLLASLGVYISIVNIVALMFGNDTKVLPATTEAGLRAGAVIVTQTQLTEAIVAVLTLVPLYATLRLSPWGRVIRGVRDNATLASTSGVNLGRVRAGVFAAGSALAGIAGILTLADVGMSPNAGMPALLLAAVGLIVGGIGTFAGPTVGSFFVALVQALAVWWIPASWSDALTFAVLILFMLFRPEGLIGRRRRLEESIS